MLEKLSTNCHWQKRTPDEALSCNLKSLDNFKFHIKRDIKYRTIYRISQELINEAISQFFSVSFLFVIVKYHINYNNNSTLGRQSKIKKQYAYLKDCFKKWSKKLECKLSLAEQKY